MSSRIPIEKLTSEQCNFSHQRSALKLLLFIFVKLFKMQEIKESNKSNKLKKGIKEV